MNFKDKRELILNGNMRKVILTLSIPLMINNLIQTIYNITDAYFIGQLPGNKIASIQFVWPILFFMMSFGMGISTASTGIISQYLGSEQNDKARNISGQVITFAFTFSLGVGIIGFLFTEEILRLLQADGVLLKNAVEYLEIMFLGLPTMFLMFAFNAIKQGEGDTYTPMKITGFSVLMNVILDPILIFHFGMGIRGAAIATVFSRGLFGVYAIATLFWDSNDLNLSVKNLKFKPKMIKKLLEIGVPSSIGQSTAALGFMVLNIFVVSFGDYTLAAFAIGNRISSLIMMPAMGIGKALSPIVGQNLGADQIDRAKEGIKESVLITTVVLVIGGVILLLASRWSVNQFTNDAIVIDQGLYYLRLITISLPLMGYFQILIGIFLGSGHTKSAMVIMTGRLWALRIPLIIGFRELTTLGHRGVWYSMILSNLFIVIVGYMIYKTGRWENKIVKDKVKKRAT